jgi:Histidine kinase
VPARPVGARPALPAAAWLARAWRRLGWRQVALAALIAALFAAFGPMGGAFLFPGQRRSDPLADMLAGRWLFGILPILFAAMVADEAYRDGVHPVLAYGASLLLGGLLAAGLDGLAGMVIAGRHPAWGRPDGRFVFNDFRFKSLLVEGTVCMAVYAYWRTTQRALERVRTSESERIRERQQLLATRLMALQARVEPQFLFDALSRIGAMHERDPDAADALLADLIALLRAMLPAGSAATSTVAREFALADAWLRLQRHLDVPVEVEVAASPLAASSSLGAMLVLPLLREMHADPQAAKLAWRLSAELAPSPVVNEGLGAPRVPRLLVRLAPVMALPEQAVNAPDTPGVARLRERLAQLHGDAASLSVAALAPHAPAFQLDLPIVQETVTDAHRPDR